jgi:serine protease Do
MGIGFAVPVNLIKQELPQLRSRGSVVRGWLGVYIQPVSEAQALAAGMTAPHGARVEQMIDNSPAQAAGLRRGDIIVEFDQHEIVDSQELPLMVGSVPIGRSATLTIIRDGAARKIPIVIGPSRESQLALAETGAPSQPSLGLTVERVDPALARQLNLDDTAGVLVAEVDPGGPGAAAGLRPRDIILEVDRQPVKNLDSWRRALDRAAGEKITLLLVRRDHGTIFITLRERG